MKKTTLIIGMLVAAMVLQAQHQEAYIKAMKSGLEKMSSANTVESLQAVAGQFERVAAVANDWHSNYYAGLAYTRMSGMAEGIESKDTYSAKALALTKKAKELTPNNSEVVALEGYVYLMQLAADPGARGQTLSPKVMQTFTTAIKMNPQNPRAMTLMAQMQFGTAQFFGSSTADACGMAKSSLDLFEKEEKGKSFDPTWGQQLAEALIGQCEQ